MRITIVDLCGANALKPSFEEAFKAITQQISEHFAPAWGLEASLHVERVKGSIPEGRMDTNGTHGFVYLSPDKEWAREKGCPIRRYHVENHTGMPSAFVFPLLWSSRPETEGLDWTVHMSHQVLELIADPDANRVVATERDNRYELRPMDICDPVQASAYEIGRVQVSDFVTPQYFKKVARKPLGFEPTHHLSSEEPETDETLKLQPFGALSGGTFRYFDLAKKQWAADSDDWGGLRQTLWDTSRQFRRERRDLVHGRALGIESLNGMYCSNTQCT
jgi:hypothetical protein